MDCSPTQVDMDVCILHDLVEDYRDGHEFTDNGVLLTNMKAQMALKSLVEYIKDLTEED